jgi:hypothetical protein
MFCAGVQLKDGILFCLLTKILINSAPRVHCDNTWFLDALPGMWQSCPDILPCEPGRRIWDPHITLVKLGIGSSPITAEDIVFREITWRDELIWVVVYCLFFCHVLPYSFASLTAFGRSLRSLIITLFLKFPFHACYHRVRYANGPSGRSLALTTN